MAELCYYGQPPGGWVIISTERCPVEKTDHLKINSKNKSQSRMDKYILGRKGKMRMMYMEVHLLF